MAGAIETFRCRKEWVGAVKWTRSESQIGLDGLVDFTNDLDGFVGGPPPLPMHPEFPDCPRDRFLEMLQPGTAHLDGPQAGLQHQVAHRVIASTLKLSLARVRLEGGQKGLGVFGRQMAAGMGAATVPSFEKGGVVDEPGVEADQKGHELPECDQVSVFRPGVGEALLQIGAIGVEGGAIETSGVSRIQLAEPAQKGRASLVIGRGRGRMGFLPRELVGKACEKDAEADEGGSGEQEDDWGQILLSAPVRDRLRCFEWWMAPVRGVWGVDWNEIGHRAWHPPRESLFPDVYSMVRGGRLEATQSDEEKQGIRDCLNPRHLQFERGARLETNRCNT